MKTRRFPSDCSHCIKDPAPTVIRRMIERQTDVLPAGTGDRRGCIGGAADGSDPVFVMRAQRSALLNQK